MSDRDWQNRGERAPLSTDDATAQDAGGDRIDRIRLLAMRRRVQRKLADGAAADKAAKGGEGGDAGGKPGDKTQAAEPPAQPLPDAVRATMERQFSVDFSAVRIHADDPAAAEIGAKAFTKGRDVHFAPGQYRPDSPDGLNLIGHELTHVVQQGAAPAKAPAPAQEKADGKADEGGEGGAAPKEKPPGGADAAAAKPVQQKGANDDAAGSPAEAEADAHGAHAASVTKGDEDQSNKKFSLGDKVKAAVGLGKLITIGTEKVRVYNEAEEAEAPKIIADIKDKYGIEISSMSTVEAIKAQYDQVPEEVKKSLKTMEWEFKELKGLKAALDHYAPVLGKQREQSSKKDKAQEVTSIGKVKQAIDSNSKGGELDNSTMGEYFEGDKNFGMFKAGTDSKIDFKDNLKQLEGTAVHEMAHGFFADQYDNFVAKGSDGYWIDQNTASGDKDVEKPPTKYGEKNAREDLAESVMLYFVAESTLSSKCPKRHAFIKAVVDAWSAGDKDKDKAAPGGDAGKAAPPKKGAACA